MDNFQLNSSPRPESGKGPARKLRSTGRVPGVLYGHKEAALGVSVNEAELRGILTKHPDSAIVDLNLEAGKKTEKINAIVRDVQRHPASGRVLHVDFQRISLDETVRMEVQVHLSGNPVGVKDQGGILEHGTRSVTILCLPTKIPEKIEVDVSGLNINDHVRLSDITGNYPDVEFADDPETWIATVIPPTVEAAPAEDEALEGAEGAADAEEKSGDGSAEESS